MNKGFGGQKGKPCDARRAKMVNEAQLREPVS
jgi:hypothetical protein